MAVDRFAVTLGVRRGLNADAKAQRDKREAEQAEYERAEQLRRMAMSDFLPAKRTEFSSLLGMKVAATRRSGVDRLIFVGADGREVAVWAYGYHAGELFFEGFDHDPALTEADLTGRTVAALQMRDADKLRVLFEDGATAKFLAEDDFGEDPEVMCD